VTVFTRPLASMPFRTPTLNNFEALIEDLFAKTDQQDEAPRVPHQFSIDSLEAAWELASNARAMPTPFLTEENTKSLSPCYGYDGAEAVLDVSLDRGKIVSELGLRPEALEADIIALRREFALRNHPDRVPVELRDMATQRMMIANDLIDQYVAKLRKAGS
jgi:hypothetical protein